VAALIKPGSDCPSKYRSINAAKALWPNYCAWGGYIMSNGNKTGKNTVVTGNVTGSDLFHLIDQLKVVPEIQDSKGLLTVIEVLLRELNSPSPDRSRLQSLWSVIEAPATVGSATGFVQQIGTMLGNFLHSSEECASTCCKSAPIST